MLPKSCFVTRATLLRLVSARRSHTRCLSFHALGHHSALLYTPMRIPSHLAGCCRIVPRPRRQHTARMPLLMSCLFNACSHRQNPCRALLLTPLVHLAHAGTEPGLDEAFDPVGLPGDWWIRTRTQEAVVLCGMNDCGERGIEGTAQAQRELFQVAGRGGARRARGRGRYGGGAGGNSYVLPT